MKKIENIKDLRSERARLKLELNVAEEILQEDFEWIQSELKPARLAGRLLNKSLINKDHGVLNSGVREGIDLLLKSVILSKAGWITKLVVPFIVKNISTNYMEEKKPEFFGMIKRMISKVRKPENNVQKNGDIHYDKSTVDEMHY